MTVFLTRRMAGVYGWLVWCMAYVCDGRLAGTSTTLLNGWLTHTTHVCVVPSVAAAAAASTASTTVPTYVAMWNDKAGFGIGCCCCCCSIRGSSHANT